MKSLIYFLFFLLAIPHSLYSNSIEISVNYLDHESLRYYNFDGDSFTKQQTSLEYRLQDFFSTYKKPTSIRINQTFSPNQIPYYSFSSKPAFPDSLRHELERLLMQTQPIGEAKFLPFSTLYEIEINGGNNDRNVPFSPKLQKVEQTRIQPYSNKTYNEINLINHKTCRYGFLPILLAILNEQTDKTTNSGKYFSYLKDQVVSDKPIDGLLSTEFQPLYWKTMEELKTYPNLMPVIKVMLLAAEGKTAYASNILQMVYQFEKSGSLLHYLMDELNWRLSYQLHADKIQPLNDRSVLNGIGNPMHTIAIKPETAGQAYEAHLRLLMVDMFIDAESYQDDFPTYASFALALKNYGFAADLYWMLATNSDETDEDKVAIYLKRYNYALHKLGVSPTVNRKNKKQFKRMDKKFRKQMKGHASYKKFTS